MVTETASCTRCGHPVMSGARFCQNCGADVSQEQGRVPTTPLVTALRGKQPITALDLLRAETLGEYEILAELGRGGMATVYLAHDIALDRRVAIKVMSTALVEEGVEERFRREARTAASLNHPHIIPIYAVRERPSLLYFVMKFIQGQSLDPILKSTGSLPIPMAQLVLAQAASALGFAHRRGVIHRDVKPANIMLDEEGWVVVTDFGIAKVSTVTGLTLTGVTVGTPAYMSPEQCLGRDVTGASDQYSLGVVAYQLITGQKPFSATTAMAMMYAHFNDTPRPLRELRPDCPPELEAAVLRMLAKEPEDRWPTIDEAFGAVHIAADDATRHSLASLALASSNATLAARISTPTSPVPPARPSHARTTAPATPIAAPAPAQPPTSVPAVGEPATPTPVRRRQQTGIAPPAAMAVPKGDPSPLVAGTLPEQALNRRWPWLWAAFTTVAAVALYLVVPPASRHGESGGGKVTPTTAPSAGPDSTVAATVTPVRMDSIAAPGVPTDSTPSAPAKPATTAVAGAALVPGMASLQVGRSTKLRLELRAQDGAPIRDARPAAWTSSAPAVASVDSSGTVRAVGAGRATIAAEVEGRIARAEVVVAAPVAPPPTPAAVATVSVAPATASVAVGGSIALTATARDAQGTVLAGREVRWSGTGAAVSVSQSGQVEAVAPGTAVVLAQVGGKSGSANITVTPAGVVEVRLVPPADSLRPGQTLQLTAIPRDGRGAPLGERRVVWESSDTSVAAVSGGLVSARRPGTARISATVEERTAVAQMTVLAPPADPAAERARAAEEISRTLDAFVKALNARSVAQLRQVYPGMSPADEERWRSMLEEKSLVRLVASLRPSGEPQVDQDTAESRFHLLLQLTYAGRPVSRAEVDYRARLQREGGKWQLSRLQQQ